VPHQLPSDAEIESGVIEAIGVKLAGILKDNSPSRIHGLLTARGRNPEWEKALEHISDHFKPIPGKPAHSVFNKKLRDTDTLKEYIKRTVRGPSAVKLSRLTDAYANPNGTPCVLIVRDFREPIGEEPNQKCLVVIADFQGKLVTAYPATEAMLG
jgi:hypothetical protein